MKISAFSCLRNGVKFDFPFIESISSLLPIADEIIIAVDPGEDNTWEELKKLSDKVGNEKIRLIKSVWPIDDDGKLTGGKIISEQSNKALDACSGDWCIYLQADEVLHQAEIELLRTTMMTELDNADVEGILFDYFHFYGSYNVVQKTRNAYRREVRAIKRSSGGQSIGDGQSFRKPDGQKLRVVRPGVHIYHYGWVRPQDVMKAKTLEMDELYHGKSDAQSREPHTGKNYIYKRFWGLKTFRGTHPKVMEKRIKSMNWNWDLKSSPFFWEWRDLKKILSDGFEKLTGIRPFEYKCYRLIKR